MVTRRSARGGAVRDQCGATSTEYAILAVLIAVAILLTVTALGVEVRAMFPPSLLSGLHQVVLA